MYELDGPVHSIFGDGYLDASGKLTVAVDFTGYADGVYNVSAQQMDAYGNESSVQLSTPTLTLDTVTPTGGFTTSATLTNNPAITLGLAFTDDRSGVYQFQISTNGGATWSAWQLYSSSAGATLPAPDGVYTVLVRVADRSGNTFTASRTVTLDRTGPALTATLSAANNGTFYDVGTPITVMWSATDTNGIQMIGASIEGQTISSSGGTIDVDVLVAGDHTITITAWDNAGNVTTKAFTFTIHPTAQGILNAVNDGAARGWISTAYKPTLVTQINNVIAAMGKGNSAATKLRGFISVVQSATTSQIAAAYKTLLLNWANDLLARL
jgi:hypothetical protein